MTQQTVTPIIPIEASADGKRNAYCLDCHIHENRQHYALCLHKLAERKKGRLKEVWSECSAAIGRKTCPAIDMREREVEKGQALYFTERFKVGAMLDKAIVLLKSVNTAITEAVAPKPKPKDLLSSIDDSGYDKAINTAMTEKTASKPKIELLEGETMLQAARRLLGKTA